MFGFRIEMASHTPDGMVENHCCRLIAAAASPAAVAVVVGSGRAADGVRVRRRRPAWDPYPGLCRSLPYGKRYNSTAAAVAPGTTVVASWRDFSGGRGRIQRCREGVHFAQSLRGMRGIQQRNAPVFHHSCPPVGPFVSRTTIISYCIVS